MKSDTPVEALKALAHPLRYKILGVLAQKERNVGEIEGVTGIGQPALSQQLAVLRRAGLVTTRKSSKLVFYRVAQDVLYAALEPLLEMSTGAQHSARPSKTRSGHRATRPGAANFARLP